MAEQDSETGIKQSRYNAAVAQLYRLDSLWQQCHYHRQFGRLMKWNESLDCVWTELAADADKDHFEKFSKYMDLISKKKSNANALNQILMQKEIFLRKLQNKQGKGTAYADEFEDDFD